MSGQETKDFGKVEGALLAAHDGVVHGWAWDHLYPDRMLDVEVYAGGIFLGCAPANLRDSRQPGGIEGAHAFKLTVAAEVSKLVVPYTIRARVRGSTVELDGAIEVDTQAEHSRRLFAYDGEVTGISGGAIEGWVVRRGHPNELLTVELYSGGEHLGSARADYPGPISVVWGGGRGFRLTLPKILLDGTVHNISLRIAGSNFELPGSPMPVAVMMVQTLFTRLEKIESDLHSGLDWVRNAEGHVAELYEKVGSDLARRLDAILMLQRSTFEREISLLRARLGVETPRVQPRSEGPTVVQTLMNDKIIGFGWHGVENNDGDSFRWMAKNAVVVLDFTAPRGARLTLRVPHILDESQMRSFRVLVNGETASELAWTQQGTFRQCEAVIPASAFRGRTFAVVNLVAAFARQPGNGDYRDLSVAVSEVRLEAREEPSAAGCNAN